MAFAGGEGGPGCRAEEGGLGGQPGQPLGSSQLQQRVCAPHQDEHGFQHSPAQPNAQVASELLVYGDLHCLH